MPETCANWSPAQSYSPMSFIADLHIHSHYSRATSKEMNLENICKWAQIKGVTVIATGDFTHPLWFANLKEKLEPAEEGLFSIKKKYYQSILNEIPISCRKDVRFILSAEISSIYSKKNRVRKIHNLLYAPDFEAAFKINSELQKIGNLKSDGRPTLGLDAKELLKIVLESGDGAMLIPAHAWTPHFSVFGSRSGFDSLEECFEDLTPNIRAIETGLSSDPAMNWRLSALDNIALVSNSDAHSPQKIAREANIFNTEISYQGIKEAISNKSKNKFSGTIEFFPEEGKYHYDGHRACKTRMSPEETKRNHNLCPQCQKEVTLGVMHRVELLSDRDEDFIPHNSPSFINLLSLSEIISDAIGMGINSKTVAREYFKLISALGSELNILQNVDIDQIKAAGSTRIGEGVEKVRKRDIAIKPGYDGEYGTIRIFEEKEKRTKIHK